MAPGTASNAANAGRIVMVDDHADSRELFAEILRMRRFEVEAFGRAEPALESIKADLPAVVVIDITLDGGMNGYEAARRIRKLPGGQGVRIVAMTGHSRASVEREGQLFEAILTKPVDADALISLVDGFFSEAT